MNKQPNDPVAHPYPPGTRVVVRDVVGCCRCSKSHTLKFRPLTGETGAYRWWAPCPVTGEPVLMAPDGANGRCESCRWWKDRDRQREEGFVATDPGFGLCLLGDGSSGKIGSIYGDGIATAPDFGCVQWERKP